MDNRNVILFQGIAINYLEHLLETGYSEEFSNGPEDQQRYLEKIRQNPDRRQYDSLRLDLSAALTDMKFDWDGLFDHFEVYPDDSETPREFVVERIWVPLFGRDSIPGDTADRSGGSHP